MKPLLCLIISRVALCACCLALWFNKLHVDINWMTINISAGWIRVYCCSQVHTRRASARSFHYHPSAPLHQHSSQFQKVAGKLPQQLGVHVGTPNSAPCTPTCARTWGGGNWVPWANPVSLPSAPYGCWAPTWWWMRRGQEGPALPFLNPSEALTSDPTAKAKSGAAGGIALEQCINESRVLWDVI